MFIGICILATDLMPVGSLFMSLLDGDAFSRDALLRVELSMRVGIHGKTDLVDLLCATVFLSF